jgi:antitoxin MazE
MKVKFLEWGNSLALRVPKAFAQENGAVVGKAAKMETRDGKLVVEIAKPTRRRRRYTLDKSRQPPPHARMGAAGWQRSLVIIARMPAIWCGSTSILRLATNRAVIVQRSC